MHQTSNPATLDKLKLRIQALRAKLIDGAVRAELGRFKTSVVDAEFDKLDLKMRTQRSTSRMVDDGL